MIRKSGYRFSRKRSCSNKGIKREDDSKKCHPALGRPRPVRVHPNTVMIEHELLQANRVDPTANEGVSAFKYFRALMESSIAHLRRHGPPFLLA